LAVEIGKLIASGDGHAAFDVIAKIRIAGGVIKDLMSFETYQWITTARLFGNRCMRRSWKRAENSYVPTRGYIFSSAEAARIGFCEGTMRGHSNAKVVSTVDFDDTTIFTL